MRKVTPVFDTNETITTVIFWRSDEFPYLDGARLTGVDEFGFRTAVEDPVEEDRVLFALRLKDGLGLLEEIARLRRKHDQAFTNLTRIMGDHRKRSIVGRLDPQL